jgi:hypothetical protein
MFKNRWIMLHIHVRATDFSLLDSVKIRLGPIKPFVQLILECIPPGIKAAWLWIDHKTSLQPRPLSPPSLQQARPWSRNFQHTPNPVHTLPLTTTEVYTSVSLHCDLRQSVYVNCSFPVHETFPVNHWKVKGKNCIVFDTIFLGISVRLTSSMSKYTFRQLIRVPRDDDVAFGISRQSFRAACCLHILLTYFGPEHGGKKSLPAWKTDKVVFFRKVGIKQHSVTFHIHDRRQNEVTKNK